MIIDCRSISKEIDEETLKLLTICKTKPKLVSFTINPDSGTISYLKSQQKKARSLGIEYETRVLDSVDDLKSDILNASKDTSVHGIFVSHPLPAGINEMEIAKLVDPEKDIEGRNPLNMGYLIYGKEDFAPCTATAVVRILTSVTSVTGKQVVIIGRSTTVGQPVAIMLLRRDRSATVTVCHSKTRDIPSITKKADIIIVAVGKAGFLKKDMVKEGAVVIDVGINILDGKIAGDVEQSVQEIAYLTPVPGGVGLVTTSILMNRVAKNASRGDSN
jgi:methylenetetrahydrofolate dehydrogenase (NADP+)/methenyltetrahydrofolate cyclohydrolase